MSYSKTIVCLANSWKNTSESDGRCVAGRVYDNKSFGEWVRPVSSRSGHEIADRERSYKGGGDPRVLDVIEIAMNRPQPEGHQRENHVIDASERWRKLGRLSWKQIQAAAEDPKGPLWRNDRSSSKGLNDGVAAPNTGKLKRSLYLVRPSALVLTKAEEAGYQGKPSRTRVRARFRLAGVEYRFAVTDPLVPDQLQDGDTKVTEALLCLSLPAGSVGGYCYKLVATVITPESAGD